MDEVTKKESYECHGCGHEFELFEHCGQCGETRKIPTMKRKRRFGHSIDPEDILLEHLATKNSRANTRGAVFWPGVTIVVIIVMIIAFVF